MGTKSYATSKVETIKTVDYTTGELIETQIETSKTFTKKIDKDKFFMTFVDFISPLYQLKSDTAKSVLSIMCCMAEYNTGKVTLSTAKRNDICNELKISPNTLTNCLKNLKDLKIIEGEKGEFEINPAIH